MRLSKLREADPTWDIIQSWVAQLEQIESPVLVGDVIQTDPISFIDLVEPAPVLVGDRIPPEPISVISNWKRLFGPLLFWMKSGGLERPIPTISAETPGVLSAVMELMIVTQLSYSEYSEQEVRIYCLWCFIYCLAAAGRLDWLINPPLDSNTSLPLPRPIRLGKRGTGRLLEVRPNGDLVIELPSGIPVVCFPPVSKGWNPVPTLKPHEHKRGDKCCGSGRGKCGRKTVFAANIPFRANILCCDRTAHQKHAEVVAIEQAKKRAGIISSD